MKENVPSKIQGKKTTAHSARAEKTIEYKSDDGIVVEKTTVNYRLNNDNAIDNVVNTITKSQSVIIFANFINKVIRLGLSVMIGWGAGLLSYYTAEENLTRLEETFYEWVDSGVKGRTYFDARVWEVPEHLVIAASVIVSIIVFLITYSLYSKYLIKKS